MTAECLEHPDSPSVASCYACDRAMCDACWGYTVDDEPVCVSCRELVTRPISPLIPTGASLFAFLIMWTVSRRLWGNDLKFMVATLASAVLITVGAIRRNNAASERRESLVVKARDPSNLPPPSKGFHPYRGALRRAGRNLAPPVSGGLTTLIVLAALALPAATLPRFFTLPTWIVAELVLGVWWIVWTVTLSVLLYRGWRVSRDLG